MTINLPRYSKDSPVDLVDGAYGAAMGQIEKELSNVPAAVAKSEQALSAAEQARASVLRQQGEIEKIRGDLDGLIAGGGEASVPIATTEKGGIVKPDGVTISVRQDGRIALADKSVSTEKLAADAVGTANLGNGQVSTEKLADGAVVRAKIGAAAVGEAQLGANSVTDAKIADGNVTEAKLADAVVAKLNKAGLESVPDPLTLEALTVSTSLAMPADAVKTANIADQSVTGSKIQDGCVSEDKLDENVVGKLNNTGAGITLDAVYPVGSVYIGFNAASPEVLFGFGKWSKIEGRFLFASDSSHASGSTGGSNDAVVVSHTHDGSADSGGSHIHTISTESHKHSATASSSGKHTHNTGQSGYDFVTTNSTFGYGSGGSTAPAPSSKTSAGQTTGEHTHTVSIGWNAHTHDVDMGGNHSHTVSIGSAGSSGTGKNMPAYMAVNMWQRIS